MIPDIEYFLVDGEWVSWVEGCREAISESGRLWHGLNREQGKEQELKERIVNGKKYKNIVFHDTMLLNLDEVYIRCQITHSTPARSYLRSRRRTEIVLLHELVAKHFIPNPLEHKFVEHIDGNLRNNHYTNLSWKQTS